MNKPTIVAGQLEALGINGVALAQGRDAIGFRAIPLLAQAGRFDGKLPIVTLVELGPYDSEGAYHHVAFKVPVTPDAVRRFMHVELYQTNTPFVDDLTGEEAATVHLAWQVDGPCVCARLQTTQPIDLMLLGNGCLEPAEALEVAASGSRLKQGDLTVTMQLAGEVTAQCAAAGPDEAEACLRGLLTATTGKTVSAHRVRLAPDQPLHLTLAIRKTAAVPARIDALLEEGQAQLATRWMTSTGCASGCADAIQRLVGFGAAYDPAHGRRFVAVNRDWAGENRLPPVFCWDNFFTSYLTSFSNPDLARESLAHIIDVLRRRGIAGGPVQRNLIVPVVYAKTVRFLGDEAFARETFPVMMDFMRFWFGDRGDGHPWRDGNDDGLIECGSCSKPGQHAVGTIVQEAFDETGYDDSPMYSAGFGWQRRGLPAPGIEYDFGRGTLNLTMIGQNSLYVAACRGMAVVAEWLACKEERAWLLREADRVAARIADRLFCQEQGYYLNRFFDGTFSTVKTMTIFYPLLAGLGDDLARGRLRETLLDPNQFWGEQVIPTVSRDDPAYRGDAWRERYWQGNYWRGSIWPPTNYIVYLALRQAGWHDLAAEFAVKSRRMFMADWSTRHHAMENYPPEGNTSQTHLFFGNGGRDPHYIWAGLLPVMALEQLFSVEDVCVGLRFGTCEPASFGIWDGFRYHGRKCWVSATAEGVNLAIPEELAVTTDQPAQFMRFVVNGSQLSFRYHAETPFRLSVTAPKGSLTLDLPAADDQGVTGILESAAKPSRTRSKATAQ